MRFLKMKLSVSRGFVLLLTVIIASCCVLFRASAVVPDYGKGESVFSGNETEYIVYSEEEESFFEQQIERADNLMSAAAAAKPKTPVVSFGLDSQGRFDESMDTYAEEYKAWAEACGADSYDSVYKNLSDYSCYSATEARLKNADCEHDIRQIMGRAVGTDHKSIGFSDIIAEDSDLAGQLVDIYINRALSLKGSFGNKQEADWFGGDIQNLWSDNNLKVLTVNFEVWFPGFINNLVYGDYSSVLDRSGLLNYISAEDLIVMGGSAVQ